MYHPPGGATNNLSEMTNRVCHADMGNIERPLDFVVQRLLRWCRKNEREIARGRFGTGTMYLRDQFLRLRLVDRQALEAALPPALDIDERIRQSRTRLAAVRALPDHQGGAPLRDFGDSESDEDADLRTSLPPVSLGSQSPRVELAEAPRITTLSAQDGSFDENNPECSPTMNRSPADILQSPTDSGLRTPDQPTEHDINPVAVVYTPRALKQLRDGNTVLSSFRENYSQIVTYNECCSPNFNLGNDGVLGLHARVVELGADMLPDVELRPLTPSDSDSCHASGTYLTTLYK